MDEMMRRQMAQALMQRNQAPGMGSTANAGGFTSGQMRSRPEDRIAFDYFGFVPGHAAVPEGSPGTQGGEAYARYSNPMPTMGAPSNHVPGMPGTPGGPVQESPTMQNMRQAQRVASAVGAAGAGLGAMALSGGHPGSLMFMTPFMFGADNALEPNIRDVWADQLRMKMQGN